MEQLHRLRDSLQLLDASSICDPWRHEAALILLSKGFDQLQHLDGLYRRELRSWSDKPRVQTLLCKALDTVTANESTKRAKIQHGQDGLELQHMSADEVACKAASFWEEATCSSDSPSAPRECIAALSKLEAHDARQMLELRAATLKARAQRKSLPSVASGLRCWRHFAESVLQYNAAHTLPPKCANDVVCFVAIFRNSGTARNYVSYVHWACVFHRLDCAWFGPEVQMVLRILDKHCIENLPGHLADKPLLTETLAARLVTLCNERPGFQDLGDLFVVAWQFLLRVPSEGIPLQHGSLSELHVLPEGRRSALTVDAEFCAHLRLKSRKHWPKGSLLSRPCCCAGGLNVLCVGHRFSLRRKCLNVGDKLVTRSPSDCLKQFRCLLSMLGVLNAERFTWKAFRAGKATSLINQGFSLPHVLSSGEWKSHAVFRYVAEEHVENAAFLRAIESDDEA